MNITFRSLCVVVATCLLGACASPARAPVEINLVALNDLHGHLEAHRFNLGGESSATPVLAGGIDTLAAALQAWRLEDRDLLLVGAGDMVGASPAMSSMWADEPTLTALDMLGMNFSSVGNHEFDLGRAELLRLQHGGCTSPRPDKACKLTNSFGGAAFTYLAANVLDTASGKPLLPAYRITEKKGVKIAFIGAVLRATYSVVLSSGVTGLSFTDEADAINRAVGEARAEGATVFVVLIHEGGHTNEQFDQPGCRNLKGPIVGIAGRLDPAVRLIVSGHTHKGFLCQIGGRTITQAEMGGHVLSRIKLSVDPVSGALRDIEAHNVVMTPERYPGVPAMSAYLAALRARSAAALARPIARLAVRLVERKQNPAGESALGDLVADSMLSSTAALGAQIAFMNVGGIRRDLDVAENLHATYAEAQAVLPFGNTIVMMDLSGAQVRDLLEQQWQRALAGAEPSTLQVSQGFAYVWDAARPKGRRVVPGSMTLNGVAMDEKARYRVVVNNFLAEGGDSFLVFAAGTNKQDSHVPDIDAFVEHLVSNDRAGRPVGRQTPAARITRLN